MSRDVSPDPDRAADQEPSTVAPTVAPVQPGPKRRRRATGGTVSPSVPVVPDAPARSPDDQDTGWGERVSDDDADDRLRREVPPHW